MKFTPAVIPAILLIEPIVYGDPRGFFMETYRADCFDNQGIPVNFVQDNHSGSSHNILRGLHYQIRQPQGKLVRVIAGEVFDVAVDLRRSSPNFGKWVGQFLSAENKLQIWIPPGFAHGFYVGLARAAGAVRPGPAEVGAASRRVWPPARGCGRLRRFGEPRMSALQGDLAEAGRAGVRGRLGPGDADEVAAELWRARVASSVIYEEDNTFDEIDEVARSSVSIGPPAKGPGAWHPGRCYGPTHVEPTARDFFGYRELQRALHITEVST